MLYVGPTLPTNLGRPSIAAMTNPERLLLLGGFRSKQSQDAHLMIELRCNGDIFIKNDCEWVQLQQRLKISRYGGIAITVP